MDLVIHKAYEWSFNLMGMRERAHSQKKMFLKPRLREILEGTLQGEGWVKTWREDFPGAFQPLWASPDPEHGGILIQTDVAPSFEGEVTTPIATGNARATELSGDASGSVRTWAQRWSCELIATSLLETNKERDRLSVYVYRCVYSREGQGAPGKSGCFQMVEENDLDSDVGETDFSQAAPLRFLNFPPRLPLRIPWMAVIISKRMNRISQAVEMAASTHSPDSGMLYHMQLLKERDRRKEKKEEVICVLKRKPLQDIVLKVGRKQGVEMYTEWVFFFFHKNGS